MKYTRFYALPALHTFAAFCALMCIAVLSSCSYSSEYPLAKPSANLDSTLLGRWSFQESSQESSQEKAKKPSGIVLITALDDKRYLVQEDREQVPSKKLLAKASSNAASGKTAVASRRNIRGKADRKYEAAGNSIFSDSLVVYPTTIDGITFINIAAKPDSASSFTFYKIERPSRDEIVLTAVNSKIAEKFRSSDELYAFVSKHKDLSIFYDHNEKMILKRLAR